jgi:hypothetical protein
MLCINADVKMVVSKCTVAEDQRSAGSIRFTVRVNVRTYFTVLVTFPFVSFILS